MTRFRTLLPLLIVAGCAVPVEEGDTENIGTVEQDLGYGECKSDAALKQQSSRYEGLVSASIPDQDPGAPFYARVGYEFLEVDGYVVIPFYRDPSCIPPDFNLLNFFHFPGPGGPGAFGCPSTMTGTSYVEPDAPPFTFPKIIDLEAGPNGVPIWAVDADQFWDAADDGVVTFPELSALDHIEATATTFQEHLEPRLNPVEDHHINIKAAGPGLNFEVIMNGLDPSGICYIRLNITE